MNPGKDSRRKDIMKTRVSFAPSSDYPRIALAVSVAMTSM